MSIKPDRSFLSRLINFIETLSPETSFRLGIDQLMRGCSFLRSSTTPYSRSDVATSHACCLAVLNMSSASASPGFSASGLKFFEFEMEWTIPSSASKSSRTVVNSAGFTACSAVRYFFASLLASALPVSTLGASAEAFAVSFAASATPGVAVGVEVIGAAGAAAGLGCSLLQAASPSAAKATTSIARFTI